MKLNIYLFLFVLLPIAFAYGCAGNHGEQENTQASAPENGIFISVEQFDASKMEIGYAVDTLFSTGLQLLGKAITPSGGRIQLGGFYGGRITSIAVQPGQMVQKGEALIRLANPEYISVQQAFLEVKATLAGLQQEFERQAALYQDHVASQKEYQQAKAAYETANASFVALREQLKLLQINPDKLNSEGITAEIELKAPFDAQVSHIDAVLGEWLGNEQSAIELIDPKKLQIEVQIFEKDLFSVSEGMAVKIQPVVNQTLKLNGHISHVSPTLETNSRSARALIYLNEGETDVLKPGMHVNVEVKTMSYRSIALPETAVAEADGQFFVLMLTNKVEQGYHFIQHQVLPLSNENGFIALKGDEVLSGRNLFLLNNTFQLVTSED